MKEVKVLITDKDGLHARPASSLCREVAKFSEHVDLVYKDKKVNMKSTLGIMSLAIPKDSELTICVTGDNENEVAEKIVGIFKDLKLSE